MGIINLYIKTTLSLETMKIQFIYKGLYMQAPKHEMSGEKWKEWRPAVLIGKGGIYIPVVFWAGFYFVYIPVMFQAYAVYDEEIGYCQGLSFLAASLLLHVSPMCSLVCTDPESIKLKSSRMCICILSVLFYYNLHLNTVCVESVL